MSESNAQLQFVGTTVGDEMKLASGGKSKVIGISYKDRSAILPSGKRPNGAYWFNAETGNFVSSTYYFEDLPAWVKAFNHDQHCGAYFGKTWERLLPEGIYQRSEPDDAAYEKSPYGRRFPYTINGGEEKPGGKFYNQFEASPFANEHLVNFAKAAIENEGLGADDVTDLLTVSFSSNDLVGHAFGPYSLPRRDICGSSSAKPESRFGESRIAKFPKALCPANGQQQNNPSRSCRPRSSGKVLARKRLQTFRPSPRLTSRIESNRRIYSIAECTRRRAWKAQYLCQAIMAAQPGLAWPMIRRPTGLISMSMTCGGGAKPGSPTGDSYVAFALPEKS